MSGVIDAAGFDGLIEIVGAAPRKYGFAPSASSMFQTEAERKASRSELFKTIDKDGSGTISFDEFLAWAYKHIQGKVVGGTPRALYAPSGAAPNSASAKNLALYDGSSTPSQFVIFLMFVVSSRFSSEFQIFYYH